MAVSTSRHVIKNMFAKENINNVTVKLGGDTSFDIYPKGWDKSYCLKLVCITIVKCHF